MFKVKNKECSMHFIEKDKIDIPIIIFSQEAMMKQKAYVLNHNEEIGWLGFVKKNNNNYYVYDVALAPQETNYTTTEITETGLQEFMEELLEKDPDKINEVRFWGHSHVEMATIPSQQDEDMFESFYKTCEYFIRVIVNKKGDIDISLIDAKRNIRYDNIPWIEEIPQDEQKTKEEIYKLQCTIKNIQEEKYKKIEEDAKEDIKKYVKKKSYVYGNKNKDVYSDYGYYNNYYDDEYLGYGWHSTQNQQKPKKKEKIENVINALNKSETILVYENSAPENLKEDLKDLTGIVISNYSEDEVNMLWEEIEQEYLDYISYDDYSYI